jgi:valyl-tRNA synthetase
MPFITEEIWQLLSKDSSIMIQPLPHIQEQIIDKKLEKQAEGLFDIITRIRNLRSSIEVGLEQKVKVSVYAHTKTKQKLIEDNRTLINNLAKLESLEFLAASKRPAATISATGEDLDIFLHFSGLFDLGKEREKIKEKITGFEKIIKSKQVMLDNRDFLKRAPAEIVEKEKSAKLKLEDEIKRLKRMYEELL